MYKGTVKMLGESWVGNVDKKEEKDVNNDIGFLYLISTLLLVRDSDLPFLEKVKIL